MRLCSETCKRHAVALPQCMPLLEEQCRSTSAAAGCRRRDDGRHYLSLPLDALSAAFPPVAFRAW